MELEVKTKIAADGDSYYIDTPIGNQIFHMEKDMFDWTDQTIWFNVYMTLYNKHCSLCNRLTYHKEKYCPECGAQMEDD